MKRFLLWLLKLAAVILVLVALFRFGPDIRARLFGGAPVVVSSVSLTQELTDMGVLVTLEQAETGEFTSSLSGFLGEWQRVTCSYEYAVQFGVDMQNAAITVDGSAATVTLPKAAVVSQRFALIGEPTVHDTAYPLTEGRMQKIQEEQRRALEEKFTRDEALLQKAWDNAAERIRALVAELSGGLVVTVTPTL